MAYATVTIPSDGVTTLLAVDFALGYISRNMVRCRAGEEVDGSGNPVYRNFTFVQPGWAQVEGAAPPVGQNWVFQRIVPKTELVVDWEDDNPITKENLNKMQLQSLHYSHELDDRITIVEDRFEDLDDVVGQVEQLVVQAEQAVTDAEAVVAQGVADVTAQVALAETAASTATTQAGVASNAASSASDEADRAETAANNAESAATAVVENAVPLGGTLGQVLRKLSNADWDTGWSDVQPPQMFSTRAAVTSATIDSTVNFIMTGGYTTLGDGGGGLYKRVASQPTHTGRVSSNGGTVWWELIVQTVIPLQFGAKGDGVTNDTVALKNALDYMRNPSTTGLPGALPRRNFRRKFDLMGRLYAVSETLDIDMCYGINITNGTLIAIGTTFTPTSVVLWASNASSNNFDNFSISDLVIQCNQKCSGIRLQNASLYQINNVYIYGWGATGSNLSYGFASVPAGWSATAMIHNMTVLPYTSWLDERPRTDYIGVGCKFGHNDIIITGCEIAAGYKAVEFVTGAAAMQFNDNHTWIANPGNNPGVEINGNFGLVMTGNYFDSHPVWIKGAGYRSLNITNNFFLSGDPAPTGAIILESPTANFILDRIVITGNTGSGGTLKIVERYSPSGTSFSATTYNYICKDNAVSQTAAGNTG